MPRMIPARSPMETAMPASPTDLPLLAAILQALDNPAALTPEMLSPVDEFHVRGQDATRELGAALGLQAGQRVLDVGSGLGGPSRHMARAHGCHVTGIDLDAGFTAVATALAARCGMAAEVEYHQGSALDLPFPAASFDAAYTQHVGMCIADKATLYAGIRRVLRPGARFGIYDLLQGDGGDALYPAPWADRAEDSHLVTEAALCALLHHAGFRVLSVEDRSKAARDWLAAMRAAGPQRLSLALVLGPDSATQGRNQAQNLLQGRVRPVQLICEAF